MQRPPPHEWFRLNAFESIGFATWMAGQLPLARTNNCVPYFHIIKKIHTVLMFVFERGIEEKEKKEDMKHKACLRVCIVFKRILDYVKRQCLNAFDICSIVFSIWRLYCWFHKQFIGHFHVLINKSVKTEFFICCARSADH